MRYINYLIALSMIWFSALESYAQCENGTTTNPSAPSPTGALFKTNTFNWRPGPNIPIPRVDKFIPLQQNIGNPFWNGDNYLMPLQGGFNSDSKPEDGWELIKQDFGYAYANGVWNGTTIYNTTSIYKTSRAYMMMYNKYTATLRIIGWMNRAQYAEQVVVKLSLKSSSLSTSNWANLKFNALFNRYNVAETALDNETKIKSVTALAQAPAVENSPFFADFQLSYDPCVCFWESAFEVSFQVKSTSDLKLTGRILGQNVDIAQKNAFPQLDYLTSVWDNATPDKPYNQQYYSLLSLKNELASKAPGDPLKDITKALKGVKDFGTGTGADKIVILKYAQTIAKTVLPYFDMFSTVFSFSNGDEKK